MSMIGNQVISTDFPVDYASGNGSTTAFTLSIAPASVNAVDVEVSGVSQSPQTYTISGTTLTFSAAPPSGTNNIVFKHRGVAGIPNTPSASSVMPASLSTGGPSWDSTGALSVTSTATITADSSNANSLNLRANSGDTYNQVTFWNNAGSNSNAQIGVEKASTDGGNLYVKTKTSGGSLLERMRIDSTGRVTKPYQPAFAACAAATNLSSSGGTALAFSSLVTGMVGSSRNSGYNTGTYRYTAPVAGLYQFSIIIFTNAISGYAQMIPYKNGAAISTTDQLLIGHQSNDAYITSGTFIIELAVNDYVDIRARSGYTVQYFGGHSVFMGYLIG